MSNNNIYTTNELTRLLDAGYWEEPQYALPQGWLPCPNGWQVFPNLDNTPSFYYREHAKGEYWEGMIVLDPETGVESFTGGVDLETASISEARKALAEYSEWFHRAVEAKLPAGVTA